MDMYVIGNVVGRLLLSYVIVWLFNWVFSRFNYQQSIKKTHSKYGYIAIALIFILPILSQTGKYA